MLRLTSLADKLLQSGDLGIYECTLEKLRHEIERNKSEKPVLKSMDVENDDDALDMFADEIDAEKLGAKTSTTTSDQPLKDDETQEAATEGVPQDFSHEIHWFYRWEKAHDADEHGPYPSTQMKTWNDLGYFPEGVWVRKAKQEIQEDLGNLYDSKRIDFELYT
jgi:CD2 antigen cytoplasmic tail-binding protein 2